MDIGEIQFGIGEINRKVREIPFEIGEINWKIGEILFKSRGIRPAPATAH
ncbi:hypothetical protein [Neobacillus kokaensis]|uniref:Uncharacterized protein n=1 Tax=Neobacillus kokaensis TaxID=2759023 RepID=A0ABQ3N188_9BACI|nr:hypothetical protein [Neobacillus kokaensis]GHH97753.1 hypothetical protein AM1BK_12960 [Neobacillus kokaensis]